MKILLVLVGLMVIFALAVPVKAGPIVLWDQPQAASPKSVITTYTGPSYGGVYAADDFSNASPWNIERIFIPGGVQGFDLNNADQLRWHIYPDAGGVPGGYPGGGGELWSHFCSPGAPEVSISAISGASSVKQQDITLDIVKAQGTPLHLPPGTYWLCFYPYNKGGGNYRRTEATTSNLAPAQVMSPTGLWGWPTTWTAWTTWKPTDSAHDIAFRLEGRVPLPPPPPLYLHAEDGWMNITDPVGTQWHELWPFFCREYHLSSWNDTSGDGVLSPSDQIDMYQKPDGEVRWYHVDEVTITLFVRPLERGEPMYIEYEGGYNLTILKNPLGTQWHEIYPVFCREYELVEWEPPSGELDFCYEILLVDKATEEPTWWHVEEVAIDIVVTIKPPPVGGEAYPVNKASLLAPWIAVAAILAGGAIWYVVRRRRAQS
jgi:hypothetical protein